MGFPALLSNERNVTGWMINCLYSFFHTNFYESHLRKFFNAFKKYWEIDETMLVVILIVFNTLDYNFIKFVWMNSVMRSDGTQLFSGDAFVTGETVSVSITNTDGGQVRSPVLGFIMLLWIFKITKSLSSTL